MKFDPTKPHGTLHGTGDNRRYEQDGRVFDWEGNEVVPIDYLKMTPEVKMAPDAGPRKRTKEEEAQYQQDVVDAATLLAASKK